MATTEPAPDLTFRPMAHVDLDAVVRMYDDAGWGPMPRETLQQWFFSGGAHGGPLVMAAVQPDGSVVGMIVLYPREVQLFERVGVACRMAGAVLAPHVRWSARADAADTSTADDFTGPLIDMLRASDEHVEARGWELMFALPHPRLAGRVTRALEGNVPMT